MQIHEFFQSSVLQLKALSELRINLVLALQGRLESDAAVNRCITTLNRHVYLFGKLFRRLQLPDAPQFIKLPLCDDLVYYLWSKVVQSTEFPAGYIEGMIYSPPVGNQYTQLCTRFPDRCFSDPIPGPMHDYFQSKCCAMGT